MIIVLASIYYIKLIKFLPDLRIEVKEFLDLVELVPRLVDKLFAVHDVDLKCRQ
jgi:hypothetical protein